jgi:thymidylate synthase (FAD)
MSVKLLYIDKDYASKIEKIAKVSTAKKPGDTPENVVKRLVKRGHLSIGRHANASFEVIGSRAMTHQLVRHPHLFYLQESQRYVEFPTIDSDIMINPGSYKLDYLILVMEQYIVIPESIKNNNIVLFDFITECIDSINNYYSMLNNGITREDSRYILPNCVKSKVIVSGNFQALQDFCCLRNQLDAQSEIRNIAREIFDILCIEAPAYFEYFKGDNGLCKKKQWV